MGFNEVAQRQGGEAADQQDPGEKVDGSINAAGVSRLAANRLRELPDSRSADARIIPHQQDAEESEGSRNRAAYHEAAAMTRYPI